MNWRNILIPLFALGFLFEFCMVCHGDTASDKATVQGDANSIFSNTIQPYAGSGLAIQKNMITPLTKGGSLTTASGSQTFTTGSFTTSGTPLLIVTVYQNPATGDLLNILVQQGSNAASFPSDNTSQMITTVCTNGYVQCDPGTQNNCRYRAWSSSSTGMAVTVAGSTGPTDQTGSVASLSDCYCFNYGCSQNGNSLIDLASIAANVGGDVLAAYLAANPNMAISSAQSSGTSTGGVTLTYYGVQANSPTGGDTAQMSAANAAAMPVMSDSGSTPLTSYYDIQTIPAAATSALQQQQQTPNSVFSIVTNANAGISGNTFYCTNLKNPLLAQTSNTQTTSGSSGGICADNNVWMILAQSAPDTFAIGYVGTGPLGLTQKGANCAKVPYDTTLGTYGYVAGTIQVVPPSTEYGYRVTEVQGTMNLWGGGCDNRGSGTGVITDPSMLSNPVTLKTSIICSADGPQFPAYSYTLSVTYDTQTLSTQDVKGCAAFETDPKYANCKIMTETWDGRPYIVNYMPTAFQMAQACMNVSGPVTTVKVCQPWFRQDITYFCPNTQSYDFTSLQTRAKGVVSSASMPTASTMTYTDPTTGKQSTYSVPTRADQPSCTQVCQTKTPAAQSVITGNQAPASVNLTVAGTAAGSFTTQFKECITDSSGNYTCPTDTTKGETVVTACGCSSDFGNTMAVIDAVDNAAQDAVCSKQ